MRSRNIWLVGSLSVVAGLLYNSWPLGYWLDPAVARHSLASGLEAVHQPYNWLFVSSDISSSLLIIIVCGLLWWTFRKSNSLPRQVVLASVALFAIGTIADAMVPERCVPNLMACPSFTQDHTLLVHGIFSITASLFLFVSLLVLWFYRRQNRLLGALLIGYVLFGIITLIEAVMPGNNGNWSQNYYITLCSVLLACLPYTVNLLEENESLPPEILAPVDAQEV